MLTSNADGAATAAYAPLVGDPHAPPASVLQLGPRDAKSRHESA